MKENFEVTLKCALTIVARNLNLEANIFKIKKNTMNFNRLKIQICLKVELTT